MVKENIRQIQQRIAELCRRTGRDVSEITLIAVSKTFSLDKIRQTIAAGITDIGESYVQELAGKQEQLREEGIRWHFIGPLQRNKVKYLVDFVYLVHSVENLKVVQEIEKRASRIGRKIDILVEVNTTREPQKHGIDPADTIGFFREISFFDHVRVRGLMTMAPFVEDPDEARPSFRALHGLRERLLDDGVPEERVRHLSMGMSHDYEVAIEEGSTMVRIGSSIFGERPLPH
jgi:PLP dependent protein